MAQLKTKRRNTVAALLALFAALLVAYFAVSMLSGSDSESTDEDTETLLLGISASEVEAVEWTYSSETYAMVLENEAWVSQDGIALDQSSATELVSTAAEAVAVRVIDEADISDDMGLASPPITVTLTLTSGDVATFSVGGLTSDATYCYVQVEGITDAYVSYSTLLTSFCLSIDDLYAADAGPAALDIVSFTVESDEGTSTLVYLEDGSDASYSSSYTWFMALDGNASNTEASNLVALDTSKAETAVDLVNDESFTSVVKAAGVEEEDDADYGFANPTLTATLNYTTSTLYETGEVDDDGNTLYDTRVEDGEFILVVGAQTETGTYYAYVEGSDAVYTLSAGTVVSLQELSADSLQPDDVCLMDWDTVDSLCIESGSNKVTINFIYTTEEDDDGEETLSVSYEIDGEEASAESVEAFLDAIDALAAESEGSLSGAAGTDSALSITFYRNTSSFTEMTLSFIKYDNSFYLVSFNDSARLLVNRNDVSELIELFEALL